MKLIWSWPAAFGRFWYRFIIGDAVFVQEEIVRYREALGVDHFMMRCHWPGLEFDKALGSIRRLGQMFGG